MSVHPRAAALIAALDLAPHPEGGFFREIHRSKASVRPDDGRPDRAALTTIHFLLVAGAPSRWHRVASDEAWHHLEGDALELHSAHDSFDTLITHRLGPYDGTATPVHVVPAGEWQCARTTGDWTLVGCTVGPGFDFADFALLRDRPDDAALLRARQPAFTEFL